MLCRRQKLLHRLCMWLYGFTALYTPFISPLPSVFSAIQEVMSIWENNKSFLCSDKTLPRKWGVPKQTAVKLAWSEVYRISIVAVWRGLVAATKPVWNSLIRQETHRKAGPYRTRVTMGVGEKKGHCCCVIEGNYEQCRMAIWQGCCVLTSVETSVYKHVSQSRQ